MRQSTLTDGQSSVWIMGTGALMLTLYTARLNVIVLSMDCVRRTPRPREATSLIQGVRPKRLASSHEQRDLTIIVLKQRKRVTRGGFLPYNAY